MSGIPTHYCTILGGPNGAGKSTIFRHLQPRGEFINADVVARGINPASPEAASMAAGRLVLKRLDAALDAKEDFVYETTLSSYQSLALMQRCKASGYEVSLVFVALNSADLNVRRVAERVATGGHHIPENVIRRRYETAFSRLPDAIRMADRVLFFDNSSIEPVMLMSIEFGNIVENHLDEALALHGRLAEAVGQSLDMSMDMVFKSTRYD